MNVDIRIGYVDVFHTQFKVDSIINEIKKYNKRNLLLLLLQLNNNYETKKQINNFDISFTKFIFNNSPFTLEQVKQAYIQAVVGNPRTNVFIVDRRSILLLIELVIQHSTYKLGKYFDMSNLSLVGIWLLKMNDLIAKNDIIPRTQIYTPGRNETPTIEKAKMIVTFRQFFFKSLELQSSASYFFRYKIIFDILKSHVKNVNLEKLFSDETGVKLEEYLDLLYFVHLKWNNINDKYNALKSLKIFPEREYKDHFSNEAFKLFRSQITIKYENYQHYLRSKNILKNASVYDFAKLLFKPVISLDDESLVCISNTFLSYSGVESLFHLLKKLVTQKIGKNEDDEEYLNIWWGEAFQQYCDNLLHKAFSDSFLSENVIKSQYHFECDGIVKNDKYTFVVEMKGGRWEKEAVIFQSESIVEQHLKTYINDKGLAQIFEKIPKFSLISEYKSMHFLPILITNIPIPHNPYTRKYFDYLLSGRSTISIYKNILPYIFLDISELEFIRDISQDKGREETFHLVVEYSKTMAKKNNGLTPLATTFRNFIIDKNIKFEANELAEQYLNYGKEMLKRVGFTI